MKVEASTHRSPKLGDDETTIRIELTGTVDELPTVEEVHALLIAVQATVRTRQEVYATMLGDLDRWQPTGIAINPDAIDIPPMMEPIMDGSWFLPSEADAARATEDCGARMPTRGVLDVFSVPPPTFSASSLYPLGSIANEVLPPGLLAYLREQAAKERNEQALTWWRATRRRYGIEPDMPC